MRIYSDNYDNYSDTINYIIVITINPHVGWLDACIPSTPHKYPQFHQKFSPRCCSHSARR